MTDNAALYDIADSYREYLDIERVSYTHLNRLIAQSICSLTVPTDYPSGEGLLLQQSVAENHSTVGHQGQNATLATLSG